MPKNSKPAPAIRIKGLSVKDPRVVMRILIGALLAVNLVVAVIAFKPFGGSADDLRKEQASLSSQLRQLKTKLDSTTQHVGNIEIARTQGDEFLGKYIMEKRSAPAIMIEELNKAAAEAGIRPLPASESPEAIEGSDDLQMETITAAFEGNYAALTKLINLLDKSHLFLIIDSMALNAPQQNGPATPTQNLNVNIKLITFVRDTERATP